MYGVIRKQNENPNHLETVNEKKIIKAAPKEIHFPKLELSMIVYH